MSSAQCPVFISLDSDDAVVAYYFGLCWIWELDIFGHFAVEQTLKPCAIKQPVREIINKLRFFPHYNPPNSPET